MIAVEFVSRTPTGGYGPSTWKDMPAVPRKGDTIVLDADRYVVEQVVWEVPTAKTGAPIATCHLRGS